MTYIIIGIVVVVFFGLENTKNDNTFNASFGSSLNILSIFNKGFCLTGGLRATTLDTAYKNALIIGQSGSGKTSTVLIGSIFSLCRGNSSFAVLDLSGEAYKLTSGYVSKSKKVYCINFSPNSDTFNPLDACHSITDCQKTAHLLIKNSGVESKSDPYWSISGEMMLSIFLQYLVFYAEPEMCTMANLVRLTETFAANPNKVDKLFVRTDEELLTSYKAMINVGEKTLSSTLSTVRSAIRVFSDPIIKQCTAKSSFSLASFRKEPSALYICTPINDVSYYAPFSALLFESLFKEIMSSIPSKKEASIFCLIDEMVTMRFQSLGLVYSNIRKFRGGCIGLVQDEKMLEMNFSQAEAHAIRTNSFSKVYLPGQSHSTCKQLEDTLGYCLVTDEVKKTVRQKPLMNASEIRMMKDESIILCGSELPIKAKMKPYFSHFILNARTQIQPYQTKNKILSDPPLIQFD